MKQHQEPEINKHEYTVNKYLTREPRILNGKKAVSSKDDAGKIRYSVAKE